MIRKLLYFFGDESHLRIPRVLLMTRSSFAAVVFSLLFLLTGCMIRVQPIADTPTPITPTPTETSTPTPVPTYTEVPAEG